MAMSLNWERPAAIAHRGSRVLWPENTMTAFAGAVDLGYRYLETDLRLTSDGVIVCIHDADVDRTTDGAGPVSSHTFDELCRLDAGFRHRRDGHPYRGTGVTIPSLVQVLTTFPQVRLALDLKEDGLVPALIELGESIPLGNRVMVGSFSDRRLAEFHRASGGTVPISTGQTTATNWVLASRLGRGVRGPASALQLPVQMRGVPVVTRRLVELAHERDVHVQVWTVNDPIEMQALLDLGVDGLVTDRPDLLKAVLEARGEWRGG
jgi:glycerophosphoryl diester phosphodiesterase